MRSLIAAAAAIVAVNANAVAEEANGPGIIETAEAYLAAYCTLDIDEMAPFYAEDAIFNDPTSKAVFQNGENFEFKGKAAILKGLGDYAARYQDFSLHYDMERRFESSGYVVFVARLSYEGHGKNGEAFSGGSPIITVIEVRDGKVASHTDYYDYRENAVDF